MNCEKLFPCVRKMMIQTTTPMEEKKENSKDYFDLLEDTYDEFWEGRVPEEGDPEKKNVSLRSFSILNAYVKNLIKVEEMLKTYTVVTENTLTFALPDELYDEFWDAHDFYEDYFRVTEDICSSIEGDFRYEMNGKEYTVRLGALAKYIYMGDADWLPQTKKVIIPYEYRDKVFEEIKNELCKEA